MIEIDFEKIANESSQKVEERIAFGKNFGEIWIVTTRTDIETTCRLATKEDKERLGIYEVCGSLNLGEMKWGHKGEPCYEEPGYDTTTGTDETRTDTTRTHSSKWECTD